jgi:hypothetical protein
MRIWGRNSAGQWVAVTDPSYARLLQLEQTLRLNQGESPLNGSTGIPAQQSVNTQIAPDAAVARTVVAFQPYFASLTVKRDNTQANPTYRLRAVFLSGTVVEALIAT